MLDWAWIIPLSPALGALGIGLFGARVLKHRAGWIASGAVGLSFIASVGVFLRVLSDPGPHDIALYDWVVVGDFRTSVGFLIDPLSAILLLVVTGVGTLIHVYSIGYMKGDPGYWRYFSYLNLFTFSMLILVMGNSYALMFIGWEGVGLCSYLLIGFWYEKKSAADAGKKAFIVNRIGDAGFLLGMMAIFYTTGSFTYTEVFARSALFTTAGATFATLCLFIGAIGKSAQIPLYVWLPDAMEGPTPVSALIHAATMVTAGVYMVARNHVLYSMAPLSMETVAVIGGLTAFFAATIGLVQQDIKRVLAYSTVSQLGTMFLACGVGAYTAGIFHLVTHAFFKGLLFLGAGSVIHALSGEQDLRKMGRLAGRLPITHAVMLCGVLAIAGFPLLSGFFSKDEILGAVFEGGHIGLWVLGTLTAALTAFYMGRLYFLAFHGADRVTEHAAHHLHEPPAVMTVPLAVLAALSVGGGLLMGWPLDAGWIHRFLDPVLAGTHGDRGRLLAAAAESAHGPEPLLVGVSVAAGLVGLGVAFAMYCRPSEAPSGLASRMRGLYRLLLNKYWVDEFYEWAIVRSTLRICDGLFAFDRGVIDGTVNGVGAVGRATAWLSNLADIHIVDRLVNLVRDVLQWASETFRKLQTGLVQNYAFFIVLGGILILSAYLVF